MQSSVASGAVNTVSEGGSEGGEVGGGGEPGASDEGAGPSRDDGEGVGEREEGEEEEETDLKLAWEVLELARVICQRYTHNHQSMII